MWELSSLGPNKVVVVIRGVEFHGAKPAHIFNAFRQHLASTQDGWLPEHWEQEVWEALAAAYPRWIRRVPGAAPPGVGLHQALSFVQYVIRQGLSRQLVTKELALERAETCFQCPKASPILGCIKCMQALQLAMPHIPEKIATPTACGACGCALELKVWLPRKVLGPATAFPFWPGDKDTRPCWMHTEPP